MYVWLPATLRKSQSIPSLQNTFIHFSYYRQASLQLLVDLYRTSPVKNLTGTQIIWTDLLLKMLLSQFIPNGQKGWHKKHFPERKNCEHFGITALQSSYAMIYRQQLALFKKKHQLCVFCIKIKKLFKKKSIANRNREKDLNQRSMEKPPDSTPLVTKEDRSPANFNATT